MSFDLTLDEMLPELLGASVEAGINQIQKQLMILSQYKRMLATAEWTKLIPITQPLKTVGIKGTDIGVYAYIHKPTQRVAYLGKGVIYSRVSRFRGVFINDGEPLNDSNYHAAIKAYDMDSDINNWQVQAIALDLEKDTARYLSGILETQYIGAFDPLFNCEAMAGKG